MVLAVNNVTFVKRVRNAEIVITKKSQLSVIL